MRVCDNKKYIKDFISMHKFKPAQFSFLICNLIEFGTEINPKLYLNKLSEIAIF